jgi:hypothetical protein
MKGTLVRRNSGVWLAFTGLLFVAAAGRAQTPSPTPSPTPTPGAQKVEERVVVSATKIEEDVVEVPNSVSVVSGESCAAAARGRSPTRCKTSSASTRPAAPTMARGSPTSGSTA